MSDESSKCKQTANLSVMIAANFLETSMYIISRETVDAFENNTETYSYVMKSVSHLPSAFDAVVIWHAIASLQEARRITKDKTLLRLEFEIGKVCSEIGLQKSGANYKKIANAYAAFADTRFAKSQKDTPPIAMSTIERAEVNDGRATIEFNEDFVLQCQNSKQKRYLHLEHIASLSPLALRLFEVLNNHLFGSNESFPLPKQPPLIPANLWQKLGTTDEKIAASQIIAKVCRGLEEIRNATGWHVDLEASGRGDTARIRFLRRTPPIDARDVVKAKERQGEVRSARAYAMPEREKLHESALSVLLDVRQSISLDDFIDLMPDEHKAEALEKFRVWKSLLKPLPEDKVEDIIDSVACGEKVESFWTALRYCLKNNIIWGNVKKERVVRRKIDRELLAISRKHGEMLYEALVKCDIDSFSNLSKECTNEELVTLKKSAYFHLSDKSCTAYVDIILKSSDEEVENRINKLIFREEDRKTCMVLFKNNLIINPLK